MKEIDPLRQKQAIHWKCEYCESRLYKPSIDLRNIVCGCGKGKGRWGVINGAPGDLDHAPEGATCKQSLQVPTEQRQEPLPPLDALFAVADGIIVCLKCRCSNPIKYGSTHYTDCPLFRPDPTDLKVLKAQLAEMTALAEARQDVIKSLGADERGWRKVAEKAIARVQELEAQLIEPH